MPMKVNPDKCTGCGACVDICPVNVITMENEKAIINEAECIDCGACKPECPVEAIDEA